MGCGCRGKSAALPTVNQTAAVPPRTSARVAVYSVEKDGQVLLSTTSPVAARAEARRMGASVKVSSRPMEPREQKELAG